MRTQAIRPRRVHDFVSSIFDYDLHAKRVRSLADATIGALQGAQLAVGALGRALAVAKDLDPKHAIKQADRFFSNTGVVVWDLFGTWVPFVIGGRPEIVVALDWTDYDPEPSPHMRPNTSARPIHRPPDRPCACVIAPSRRSDERRVAPARGP
jgi:hypothetical protein